MICKQISAKPGEPSTFWSNDNGTTWYLSKADAQTGDKTKAVNPDDYVYTKSFLAANKKTLLTCGLLVLVLAGIFYLWHAGKITFHIHK